MKRTLRAGMACLVACVAVAVGVPDLSGAAAPVPGLTAQDCGDFLAGNSKKPPNLVYDGCLYLPDRQGKPLQATYHVQGRFAARVESYFVKTVGMDALKRVCCQWSSRPTQFTGKAGAEFSITMSSGETIVGSRSEWASIPRFEIVVETFTEEI
ncbi:DUF4952 domain-containing protein [Azospirillum picis]|uniref:DUF4952 domain-containing protein n=1 Tax=Azospirillum picis TaxID=488438 RepID=A0ABU0MSD8_9PROT|nr:DUF4952 domain-containing protein [Azospirillum picis]MBP2301931.1 hypothetical protein [Azospirillum picis]MDQ0536380.1 hypothetical protein [Azospirillum picis]